MPGPNDHSASDMIEASKQMYKERAKGPLTQGKGSKRRPGRVEAYRSNYDRIFGPKEDGTYEPR